MERLILFVLFASSVIADYDQFYFSTNSSNYRCPGSSFQCSAPSACTHDRLLDKWYCCDPGQGSVCWSPDAGCDGTPSASEIACGDSSYTFCCLKEREECTQTRNQINICWARATVNVFQNATRQEMNQTYSSLSSASPSATSLTFNIAQIFPSSSSSIASTSATSTTSSSTTASTSAPINSQSSTTTPVPSGSSSSLSGGAIAGIVIAVVAGLTIIAAAALFLWRRSKSPQKGNELDVNPYTGGAHAAMGHAVQQEKYAHEMPEAMVPAVELDAQPVVSELDENTSRGYVKP